MSVKASIIIPVRNKLDFTARCLQSITASPPRVNHEIIVVDNASDDGTRDFLEEKASQGQLNAVRNDPPRPFSASCNQGARIASGDYLVFLNNDTEAFPGWLDEMVGVSERDSRIGAVGAKLLYPDGTIQHAGVAFHYFKKARRYGPYHIFRKFPRYAPAVMKEREFQCVTGACLLSPKNVFLEMDGFDERFINCFEDVDYCLRLRQRAYRVVYTPRAELIHYEGQTLGRNDNILQSDRVLREKWEGKLKDDDLDYLEPEGFIIQEETPGQLSLRPGKEMQSWWHAIHQLVELRQYGMALEEMDKLEKIIGGNHPEIFDLKGKCHLGMGDFRGARLDYARAQSEDPLNPDPKWMLVQVALAEGKTREARRRLEGLIERHPDDERCAEWREMLDRNGQEAPPIPKTARGHESSIGRYEGGALRGLAFDPIGLPMNGDPQED